MGSGSEIQSFSDEQTISLKADQSRCEADGENFGARLDIWADAYGADLERLRIAYPSKGSTEAKSAAIAAAMTSYELREHLSFVRALIDRLKTNGKLTAQEAEKLGKLQSQSDAEKTASLKTQIVELRTRIVELRSLF